MSVMVWRGPSMDAFPFVLIVADWAFRRPKATETKKFKLITMTSTCKKSAGLMAIGSGNKAAL
jgi:hypothetical protein